MSLRTQWKVQAACFGALSVAAAVGTVLEFHWVRLMLLASSTAWLVRCLVELRDGTPDAHPHERGPRSTGSSAS